MKNEEKYFVILLLTYMNIHTVQKSHKYICVSIHIYNINLCIHFSQVINLEPQSFEMHFCIKSVYVEIILTYK